MEAKELKGKEVWAVITADPDSQEPGYLAYTSLFANRDDALRCLSNAAHEDAKTFDAEIRWMDGDDEPWCQLYCDGIVRITHSLQQLTIQ